MTLTLAFYKGRGNTPWERFQSWAIRTVTCSQYSHVELIPGDAVHWAYANCLSSSGRDGGVREKRILLRPEHWDLIELRIDPTAPAKFIRDRIGAGYDYRGIVLSQLLPLGRHNRGKWFCSEIIGAAFGLDCPQRLSPQMLFEVVTLSAFAD